MKNKTIIFLGSSVTYGAKSGGMAFPELLAKETGCLSVKEAVSGTTLADIGETSYISRLKNMTTEKADCFVCQLSTNDARKEIPLGKPLFTNNKESLDCKTVCGAIEYIILYAKEKWNCPIVFYTNPKYSNDHYEKMVFALRKIAKYYGVSLIDLYDNDKVNNLTQDQRKRYMADPIHPYLSGYQELWLPIFKKHLENTVK